MSYCHELDKCVMLQDNIFNGVYSKHRVSAFERVKYGVLNIGEFWYVLVNSKEHLMQSQ